jgi:biopolymer transport protein ExbD
MSAPGGEDDYNTTINVVPLVDIMLVLLIIFIITLPVMTHAVKIDLPRNTPETPPPPTQEPINIEVQFDGSVLWNGTPVTMSELRSYVGGEALKNPQPEVHIMVDKRAKYDYAANVLFILQCGTIEKQSQGIRCGGGLKKIGFVTDARGGL